MAKRFISKLVLMTKGRLAKKATKEALKVNNKFCFLEKVATKVIIIKLVKKDN